MFSQALKTLTKVTFRLVLGIALAIPLITVNTPIVQADTSVGGPIVSDTTWTAANSPYIVTESVDVWEGVTLTIEPGVTVKFDSEKKIQVNGGLIAQGTDGNLITFTSNQASPAPGDWGNIEFTSTAITTTMDTGGNYVSGSVLQYCLMEYAGYDADSAIDAHSLLIDHCTVRNNEARGIYNSHGQITNNTITNNSAPERYSHPNDHYGEGGGIYAANSMVRGNTVISNSISLEESSSWQSVFAYGGGIYAPDSTVMNNDVSNNTILAHAGGSTASGTGYGGGIYAPDSTVSGNVVTDNRISASGGYYSSGKAYGGGIYAPDSTVSSNVVTDNWISGSGGYYWDWAPAYGGGIYARDSSILTGNIVNDNSAVRGGGIYAWYSTVSGNTVSGNSAYYSGGSIYAENSTVSGNTVSGNSAYYSGGSIYAENSTVTGNTVRDNSAGQCGGGIYARGSAAGNSTVSNNIVSNNSASYGAGIYAHDSTVLTNTVTANSVSGEYCRGAGAYVYGSEDFLYNTVVGNSGPLGSIVGGVAINGTPQVHYNNFYGNEPYDVAVVSSGDISGTNNYWGTASSVDILAQVYDWYDDSSRGKFLYVPYSQDPDPNAPVPAPQNLQANFTNGSAALSWEPIPSTTTGYGYKVYYDSDASGPPYDGSGAAQGDSPIDVGNVTTYTLSGLGSGDYYVAVTAYDTQGRESWYSNEVSSQQADFTALPTSGFAPLTVVFTNTSTGDYTTSLWDLGDQVTSTLESPTHTYTVAGAYTVTLSVSGSVWTDTLTRTNYITVYEPVEADFSASPRYGTPPLTVHFTDASSGPVATWEWVFGDGGISALQHPTHTYTTIEAYTVSLTVRAAGDSAAWPGGTSVLTRSGYIAVQHRVYLPVVLRQ